MHARFINNELCFLKSITTAIKKKKKKERERENADAESKPALYIMIDVCIIKMFLIRRISQKLC